MELTCPRSHSKSRVEQGLEVRSPDFQFIPCPLAAVSLPGVWLDTGKCQQGTLPVRVAGVGVGWGGGSPAGMQAAHITTAAASVTIRVTGTTHTIFGSQRKMKTWGPFLKNYYEFQDSPSRASNQECGPSEHADLCTGRASKEPAPTRTQTDVGRILHSLVVPSPPKDSTRSRFTVRPQVQ